MQGVQFDEFLKPGGETCFQDRDKALAVRSSERHIPEKALRDIYKYTLFFTEMQRLISPKNNLAFSLLFDKYCICLENSV